MSRHHRDRVDPEPGGPRGDELHGGGEQWPTVRRGVGFSRGHDDEAAGRLVHAGEEASDPRCREVDPDLTGLGSDQGHLLLACLVPNAARQLHDLLELPIAMRAHGQPAAPPDSVDPGGLRPRIGDDQVEQFQREAPHRSGGERERECGGRGLFVIPPGADAERLLEIERERIRHHPLEERQIDHRLRGNGRRCRALRRPNGGPRTRCHDRRDRGRMGIVAPDHAWLHAVDREVSGAEMMAGMIDLDPAGVGELGPPHAVPHGEIDQLLQRRDQGERLVVADASAVAGDHESVLRRQEAVEQRSPLIGSRIDVAHELLLADEVVSLRVRDADGAIVEADHADHLEGHAAERHHRRGRDRPGAERLAAGLLVEPCGEQLPDVVEGHRGGLGGGAGSRRAEPTQLGERLRERRGLRAAQSDERRLDEVAPRRHRTAGGCGRLECADHVNDPHEHGDRRNVGRIEFRKRHDATEFGAGGRVGERRPEEHPFEAELPGVQVGEGW